MKLEYNYDGKGIFIAITMTTVILMIMLIFLGEFKLFEGLLFISFIIVVCIIYVRHINPKQLKKIGRKVNADITKVERGRGKYGTYRYRLWITFENRLIRIPLIKYNIAFCILRLLLNSYPVKVMNVPIEIYVHKNRVYADLASVDLTKIEGYEEAKRAAEEIWPREVW